MPSMRLTTLAASPSSSVSLATAHITSELRITRGNSLLINPLPTDIGITMAVQPTMARMLNMLLPTTLPNASSALSFNAAVTLTTSSGADVPIATIVRPITRSEMPKRLATAEAPSVNALAPMSINPSPSKRIRMSIIFVMLILL